MPSPVVEFRGCLQKLSHLSHPSARLKELACLNRVSFHRDFWAVRDITFEIHQGETFCIVGENGSGKSTLLQMVAGILHPTSGADLGSRTRRRSARAWDPDSIPNSAAATTFTSMPLSSVSPARRSLPNFDQIEEFAEIGDFIDQPVKTYSSGMAVRLAFAVAIHVDPEILLVDEALAVGDIYFHQRCMRKVHELRENGVTILFVSHSVSEVKSIGDRALWLDGGQHAGDSAAPNIVVNAISGGNGRERQRLPHHAASKSAADRAWPGEGA